MEICVCECVCVLVCVLYRHSSSKKRSCNMQMSVFFFFFFFLLEYDVAGPHEYPLSLHKHVHAVGGEDRDQIGGREGKKRAGAGESKISGSKDKFLLQKKRRKKQFLKHVLI